MEKFSEKQKNLLKKGLGHFTLNLEGFPIEIKKMKKNNFLNNDVFSGQVKKMNNRSKKASYIGNQPIEELLAPVEPPSKKGKKKEVVKEQKL